MNTKKQYGNRVKYILPNPFFLGGYSTHQVSSHERIIDAQGANDHADSLLPSNLLKEHCVILDPIEYHKYPDSRPHEGKYIDAALDMQQNTIRCIQQIWDTCESLLVIGGDHTIPIGTGAGLATCIDMSSVGMIYVDAHGDANTMESSGSKAIFGMPLAINLGYGSPEILAPYRNNFITKSVHIGARDIDGIEELHIMRQAGTQIINMFDIVEHGFAQSVQRAIDHLSDCTSVWLSIDIDALDAVYFNKHETDVPVSGGLNPRELLYLTYKIQQTGKLKVTEIVQINESGENTPLTYLGSRIGELALGLGAFRYGL